MKIAHVFLKGARGYLGRGKASQSSIPRKVMSGGSRFARALPRSLKNRFQRSSADCLAFELALCYFGFRLTAQPPTISSAAAYVKNYWNPWYCHTLLFDCFLHTSILSSLLQCSTVFIPHTMVSLCYVKCVRRGSVTKLTSKSRLTLLLCQLRSCLSVECCKSDSCKLI